MKLKFAALTALAFIASAQAPVQPLNDLPQPYKTSRDWGKPPDNVP